MQGRSGQAHGIVDAATGEAGLDKQAHGQRTQLPGQVIGMIDFRHQVKHPGLRVDTTLDPGKASNPAVLHIAETGGQRGLVPVSILVLAEAQVGNIGRQHRKTDLRHIRAQQFHDRCTHLHILAEVDVLGVHHGSKGRANLRIEQIALCLSQPVFCRLYPGLGLGDGCLLHPYLYFRQGELGTGESRPGIGHRHLVVDRINAQQQLTLTDFTPLHEFRSHPVDLSRYLADQVNIPTR